MVISTMPRKYAVPAGRPRIRVFTTRAARYIGCAVSDREGLDGLDTHPTSQISGRLGYAIGKTRKLWSWHEKSLWGVCPGNDAGVFGGPDPAALLCLVSSGMGQAGQQPPAVGA